MSTVLSELVPIVDDRLLDTNQAAEVLGVRREYVSRMCASGVIPSRKIGKLRRIWMSDLREWVNAH